MQSQNKIFDDFAKVATGAAGTFAGAARELEAQTREKVREWLGGMDMVGRDEFEAVRSIAARAMDEIERLNGRISALERSGSVTTDAPAGHAPDAAAARGGAGPDGQPTA